MFIYNKKSMKLYRITQEVEFIEKKIKELLDYSNKLKS